LRLLSCLLLICALDARGDSWREQRLPDERQQDPPNVPQIRQLAALKLDDASGVAGEADREAALDEVQILYLRVQSLDAQNVEALYHLGVVSWMKVFPAVVAARREAVMEPETPGPVRNRATRAVLNGKYRADIDYAIATLEQAVALEPTNNSAMAYLQMAYRARADFKDTRAQWDDDQTAAGRWRDKAYEVGMLNQQAEAPVAHAGSPPMASWSVAFFPTAMVLEGAAMDARLLHSIPANCPAAARVVGAMPAIVLNAVVDYDGTVIYVERLEGPIEGVPAAIEAAKQRQYRPMLVNGKSVRVKTTIEIVFGPCGQN
jgi:hypothetical protein